jgi:hypothetical protein
MMDKERNVGVTEARFALTLLTCLLVAIGYVALLRLGPTKESDVEPGQDDVTVSQPDSPKQSKPEFQVLHVEKAEQAERLTNKRR